MVHVLTSNRQVMDKDQPFLPDVRVCEMCHRRPKWIIKGCTTVFGGLNVSKKT